MCEWISIEDRLPEANSGLVIVASNGQGYCEPGFLALSWRYDQFGNRGWANNCDLRNISHWLPIPPLPIMSDEKEEA